MKENFATKEEMRDRIMEECDREFGNNPRYWYALLSITIHNQEATEEIIRRMMRCFADYKTDTKLYINIGGSATASGSNIRQARRKK